MRSREDIYRLMGASNHCKDERQAEDFYSTDEDCVNDLLEREKFCGQILEPCCGTGNISKTLEKFGHVVTSTDLIDRGYGKGGVDFFTEYTDVDMDIITNPPFGLVTDFIEHALSITRPGHKIALFLKLQFLEGSERYEKIFSKNKLEKIYIYSKRVACYKDDERYQKDSNGNYILDKNGNKKKIGSAVCYAWFIFNTDYNGLPKVNWIVPKKESDCVNLWENL